MLKKEITYKDHFSDDMITRTFYFNLTEAEWLKMEVSELGFQKMLERLQETKDIQGMLDTFENLLLKGYGERVGDDFIKSEAALDRFKSTNAYSSLFMELFQDDKKAIEFLRAMLPQEMMKGVAPIQSGLPTPTSSPIPPPPMPAEAVAVGQQIANDAGM